jgi:hypothetical protein
MFVAAVLVPAMTVQGQGQDQFAFGVSAGVSIPAGVGADLHKTGYNATVMWGIGSVDSPFGVRFDGMYSSLGERSNTGLTTPLGKATVTSVSANFLFNVLGSNNHFYLIGGLGGFAYNPDGEGTKSKNDFGLNGGAGLFLPGVNTFIEARWFNFYRALPDPETNVSGKKALQIFPITIGVMF